jgi:hypothetical protein
MSLVGALPAGSFATRALVAILVIAFLSPWFLIGAGLLVAGVRSLVDFRQFGALWFCLLPGLLLVGLVAYVAYHYFYQDGRGSVNGSTDPDRPVLISGKGVTSGRPLFLGRTR